MDNIPKKLHQKLKNREEANALRQLGKRSDLVDFSSNDYLGFAKSEAIFQKTHQFLVDNNLKQNGATGSRLLSGNYELYNTLETEIANYHNSESALLFNSGYDTNIGFFSSVPQRADVILYDELSHASIRDGIRLSLAKAFKFKHNDLDDLSKMLKQVQHDKNHIYVVTESVFSMDGDSPDLVKLTRLCSEHNAYLIVDEAHAIGVFGNGKGLVQELGLEDLIFARIITYGKAMGCHGAAILGSGELKQYLVNFARSLIYSTGLPPHSLASIQCAYDQLFISSEREKFHKNITFFKAELKRLGLKEWFIQSDSAIQCCIIKGNDSVKSLSKHLQNSGFDVKPILSPTVPQGQERLRFCLHSYNSYQEITEVLELLSTFIKYE